MRSSDAFPSKYLGKGDVPSPTTAIIERVDIETLTSEESGDEDKVVMHFRGSVLKPMIVNRTNFGTIEDAYGDTDDWIGKPIEVYFDGSIMFKGKKTGGVRVRIPAGHPNTAPLAPVGNTMTYLQAQKSCSEVGISKDELVAALKAAGHAGWNPSCAALVASMVTARGRANLESAAEPGSFDDSIPF